MLAESSMPLLYDDFYPVVKFIMQNKCQLERDAQVEYKLQLIKPVLKKWYSSSDKSRKTEVLLYRLRIANTCLTQFLTVW